MGVILYKTSDNDLMSRDPSAVAVFQPPADCQGLTMASSSSNETNNQADIRRTSTLEVDGQVYNEEVPKKDLKRREPSVQVEAPKIKIRKTVRLGDGVRRMFRDQPLRSTRVLVGFEGEEVFISLRVDYAFEEYLMGLGQQPSRESRTSG